MELASSPDWGLHWLDIDGLPLLAVLKNGVSPSCVVYIEGDGRAWSDRRTPPSDPTPLDPLPLRLARRDPAPKVIYLSRPCQYLPPDVHTFCHQGVWTESRFAGEVVAVMHGALNRAKALWDIERFHLVGYSGGGAVALLIAAERDDVGSVMTVAGNLDPAAWAAHHQVTPLRGSSNPASPWYQANLDCPQVHFVGTEDEVVPPETAWSYVEKARPFGGTPRVVRVEGFDHRCCWEAIWPELLAEHRSW